MKEYPLRPDMLGETKSRICECGHARHYHKIKLEAEEKHGECGTCLCSQYHFEQELTSKEYLKLEFELYKKQKEKSVKHE